MRCAIKTPETTIALHSPVIHRPQQRDRVVLLFRGVSMSASVRLFCSVAFILSFASGLAQAKECYTYLPKPITELTRIEQQGMSVTELAELCLQYGSRRDFCSRLKSMLRPVGVAQPQSGLLRIQDSTSSLQGHSGVMFQGCETELLLTRNEGQLGKIARLVSYKTVDVHGNANAVCTYSMTPDFWLVCKL